MARRKRRQPPIDEPRDRELSDLERRERAAARALRPTVSAREKVWPAELLLELIRPTVPIRRLPR